MSGNTSGLFRPDGMEMAPERGSTRDDDSPGAGLADFAADDLVARAFAILAEERERWDSAPSVNLRPRSPS
jgi:hypothetical protein